MSGLERLENGLCNLTSLVPGREKDRDMSFRVFLNDQKFSDRAPNEIYVVSTCEGSPKKISEFYLNICRFAPTFVIGLFYKTKIQASMGSF